MKRVLLAAVLVLAVGSAVGVARATQQPPPGPAPTEDRVGFPEGYQTNYTVFYTFDRPDNKQVRVIYGNDKAASARFAEPFPYGSILVMETYRAIVDPEGSPVVDAQGRFMRGELTGIFVMRKEPGFGEAYEKNRTGEWEYVAFRPDRTYSTPPQNTASCAICHFDTRGANDWTYRTPLFFNKASGALPQGVILNYSFVPDTIRVKAGSTVSWYNTDTAFHTITADDGSWDAGKLLYGFSFSHTFDTPGTFEFHCNFHASMKGRVVVE
jgi:hypothetical protein